MFSMWFNVATSWASGDTWGSVGKTTLYVESAMFEYLHLNNYVHLFI